MNVKCAVRSGEIIVTIYAPDKHAQIVLRLTPAEAEAFIVQLIRAQNKATP